jgi:DNA modification methylase
VTSVLRTILLVGDVCDRLRVLQNESIHCVVTSPPYFGLRDYGCADKIGLESTPDEYIAKLVDVFSELRRVLRSDGTLWLNLGDSYASTPSGAMRSSGLQGGKAHQQAFRLASPNKCVPHGLKPKDRLMIPARVALALQADGWYLRDEVIWHKPNPMPVSVTDRTTPAHEMLYMLSKSARYFYDMDAIKTPASQASLKRYAQPTVKDQKGGAKQDVYESGFVGQRSRSRRPNEILHALAESDKPPTAQPRSVWSIATKPFKGAHFATFPPDLARPCILAGCPIGGTVLDPFAGSGTVAVVANELNRNSIGIELNPEYAQIAAVRLGITSGATDGSILARVVAA